MKKFLIKLSYTVLPIWAGLVSLVCYITFFISPDISGDIGRLGCIPFGHEYDAMLEKSMLKEKLFRTVKRSDFTKDLNVDVLTIGDSFSQQQEGGYQNYLAAKGLNTLNCWQGLFANPFQYAYTLLEQGLIDSTKVKVLIVENCERNYDETVRNFDFKAAGKTKQINEEQYDSNNAAEGNVRDPNAWSLSRARDYILYKTGWSTPIYKEGLDRDLFQSDEPKALYFYNEDITKGLHISEGNKDKIRWTFNTLCEKAAERGIILIHLIAVDKYDLYQTHIVDNPYPVKSVNEEIAAVIGENPHLLIAKNYLLPLVDEGEKDIFMFHDTHWSYKASRVIADEIFLRISQMEQHR